MEHVRFAVSFTRSEDIDRHGIVWAVHHAMKNALQKLHLPPELCTVLLDGSLRAPSVYKAQKTIIHGDATEPVISAAAILAKVERDKKMKRYGLEYPEYGFEVHKGYGTKSHMAQIQKLGLCPIHRSTFCKNIPLVNVHR
jgi:ribonuclease HII